MAIHIQFISEHLQQWEGRKATAYIPCYVKPEAQERIGKKTRNYTGINGTPEDYTVMGASGVTIGTGCDLGQQTAQGLLDMGVPPKLVTKFAPYIGLSKDAAIRALYKAPLCITEAECDELDRAVHADYIHRAAKAYDRAAGLRFEYIPAEAQTVIMSLFYQLGSPHGKPGYPKTWALLCAGAWDEAAQELCTGFTKYANRRADEGALLDCIGRVK